jgi:hypothetical protein
MFVLSGIGIINISLSEILYFLLITSGIGLVYSGSENKNNIIIFSGTVLFLFGIFFLTKLNFNVKIEDTDYIIIALLILSAGLLIIFINNMQKKVSLVGFIVLFVLASVLIAAQTKFELERFFGSITEIVSIYWLVIIIFILIVALLKSR